jgi:hypothetical protein
LSFTCADERARYGQAVHSTGHMLLGRGGRIQRGRGGRSDDHTVRSIIRIKYVAQDQMMTAVARSSRAVVLAACFASLRDSACRPPRRQAPSLGSFSETHCLLIVMCRSERADDGYWGAKTGRCAMYGICGDRPDGGPLNCPVDIEAPKADAQAEAVIKALCPRIWESSGAPRRAGGHRA